MPRAKGNDLAEIFGYAPDDTSEPARKQWKSRKCPFVDGSCIKHSHPSSGQVEIYGSCSVRNKSGRTDEEVIICAQRLYADDYWTLRQVVRDATSLELPLYSFAIYTHLRSNDALPTSYVVMIGRNSGREIGLSNPGTIDLSLDWVLACVANGRLVAIIPCEVQSMDTTGNYCANWEAYRDELQEVPNSNHGMNWANVWKRLIPQLILKGAIASTSTLSNFGHYFVVPDRVYVQFEKLVGRVELEPEPGKGILSVMTYSLGDPAPFGSIRQLVHRRIVRIQTAAFAKAFGSGQQVTELGPQLDRKVAEVLRRS